MKTYDLIAAASELGARGSMGFDDDASLAMFEADLDALATDGADKLLARRHVAAGMRAQADHLKATAMRLLERVQRIGADADRIDDGSLALVTALQEAAGVDRIKTPDGGWCKCAVRKSVAVEVPADVATLPDGWCRIKREADKTAIGTALKAGETVPGCSLMERESRSLAWSK